MGQPLSAAEASRASGAILAERCSAMGRRLVADALDMVFPPRCLCCRADLGGRIGADAPAAGRLCGPCCGALAQAVPSASLFGRRANDRAEGVALGPYAGTLRDAVLRCKRATNAELAIALGVLLGERHAERLAAWNAEVVVPVPMHWRRRWWRGSSAALLVARGVAVAAGVRVAEALVRRRATVMQNRLPIAARHGNVAGAIAVRRCLAGSRVVLVDDVVTTGATIAECRRVLLAAGAAAVFVAVVARAEAGDG